MSRKIFATICLSHVLFWLSVSLFAFMMHISADGAISEYMHVACCQVARFGLIMGVFIPIGFVVIRSIILLYSEIWRKEEPEELEENEEV